MHDTVILNCFHCICSLTPHFPNLPTFLFLPPINVTPPPLSTQGCGVPSQRAEVTLDTLASQQCSLLFADTHTLKALNDDSLAAAVDEADLATLRGGVCKTGSGATVLEETVGLAGVQLSTVGKAV